MKINPVIEFEGAGVISYFAKGIHKSDHFLVELKRQWDETMGLTEVRHCHARFCPSGPEHGGMVLLVGQKPGRGAFPITYVDLL
jgi:hypothetical protein